MDKASISDRGVLLSATNNVGEGFKVPGGARKAILGNHQSLNYNPQASVAK